MREFKVRVSLKYKLLFLMTSLPVISLALYLFFATGFFRKDKIAYVFDSSAAVSHSLSGQMKVELQAAFMSLRTIVEHYDPALNGFSIVGQDLFEKNPKIHALLFYRRQDNGEYLKLGQLAKSEPQAQAFVVNEQVLSQMRNQAIQSTVFALQNPQFEGSVFLSFRLGERNDPHQIVIVAFYQADEIVNAFNSVGLYTSIVMTRDGTLSFGDTATTPAELGSVRSIFNSKVGEGTGETKLQDGHDYLVSYSSVGFGDLVVVSKIDKIKALKAVDVLVFKSILFFIGLIAATLVISVIASSSLTSALRELFEATGQIAKGDFSVRVTPQSRDEVGGLAESFNYMAEEVSRLMSETAEKARMESELSTVRTVQETLFPPSSTQFGPLHIRGHFEPASECGGDWWSYSKIGSKIYLWIGDATGHGAPAALITAAARSAAAVIELLPDVGPGRALSIMNHAIQETSKGQIMMTFFMASIDLEKSEMTYASASHDPPYLMKHTGQDLKKKDLVPLNDVNGPRLGDQRGHQYKETTIKFGTGDMVFMYTDGILDIQDQAGKKWGERAFLKSLLDSANAGQNVEEKIENLRRVADEFRRGASLIDDVTMVLCEFSSEARAKAVA